MDEDKSCVYYDHAEIHVKGYIWGSPESDSAKKFLNAIKQKYRNPIKLKLEF